MVKQGLSKIELIDRGYGPLFDVEIPLERARKIATKYRSTHTESAYAKLQELGIPSSRIRSFPEILFIDPDRLQQRYDALISLGFSPEKIGFHANLLNRQPKVTSQRYHALQELGFTDDIVQRRTELLLLPTESIMYKYRKLERRGLTQKHTNTLATLLGQDVEVILRKNSFHRRLLSRSLLETFLQLNQIPEETIEANYQWLTALGVDPNNGVWLGTRPSTKRKKMAWILREVMGYRQLTSDEDRTRCKRALRSFVRNNPHVLSYGRQKLEKSKDKLTALVRPYLA